MAGYKPMLKPAPSKVIAQLPTLARLCNASSMEEALNIDTPYNYSIVEDAGIGYYLTDKTDLFSTLNAGSFPQESVHKRVLVLGDSFTAPCCIGKHPGYVERLDRHYPNVDFINTASGGYSERHHLAILRKYFEKIKPDAVLLAFCLNDFTDNLMPKDRYYTLPYKWILRYRTFRSRSFAFNYKMPEHEALRLYQLYIGCPNTRIDRTFVTWGMMQSRLGSLLFDAWHFFRFRIMHQTKGYSDITYRPGKDVSYEITEEYLTQIRDFLKNKHAPLYALIIPDKHSVTTGRESSEHQDAVKIFTSLEIPYLDPLDRLNREDYLAHDLHWTPEGHAKIADLLMGCFGDLSNAETIPFCRSKESDQS